MKIKKIKGGYLTAAEAAAVRYMNEHQVTACHTSRMSYFIDGSRVYKHEPYMDYTRKWGGERRIRTVALDAEVVQ